MISYGLIPVRVTCVGCLEHSDTFRKHLRYHTTCDLCYGSTHILPAATNEIKAGEEPIPSILASTGEPVKGTHAPRGEALVG